MDHWDGLNGTDPDFLEAARHMIDIHGAAAASRAHRRAAALRCSGDDRTAAIWDEVEFAIVKIH
jgi:hypothetical protein